MRLSLAETEIMNLLCADSPKNSSVAKLVKGTGRARNEVVEILDGLKALKFITVSTKHEVWLIKHGKEYLGIKQTAEIQIDKDVTVGKQVTNETDGRNKVKLLAQVEELGKKLSGKLDYSLNDAELKAQALTALSVYLSDDIKELFDEIARDLLAINELANVS